MESGTGPEWGDSGGCCFLYYAYGSNLLRERLLLSNPSAALYGLARLQVCAGSAAWLCCVGSGAAGQAIPPTDDGGEPSAVASLGMP